MRHDSGPLHLAAPGTPGEGPLVPLLGASAEAADAVTLDTWHQALSSALIADIPHDLFGFWLYPTGGNPVLLGPPELAADRLAVPQPPAVSREQIALLEEIVRDAGYRSTIATVASYEGTDVGLLLFGALAADVHGVRERVSAQLAADAVGPSLARLARRWRGDGSAPALPEAAELAETAALLADVCANAASPRELARGVSEVLRPLVPHRRIELLVPGSSAEQWYRLGEHPGGPLWGDPDLVIRAGNELARLSVPDGEPLLLSGMPGEAGVLPELNGGVPTHSVVGVRLAMAGRTVGALLLATTDERRYSEDDALLLSRLAPILAPRVDGFVMAGHLQVLRSHVAMQRSAPSRIARVLESLATVGDPAEATRRAQSEAAGLIMFDEMWFALMLGDPTRVAMFAPGERRALPDLPQIAAGDTPLGRVLRGDIPRGLTDVDDRTELIVPLRVAGRIVGAMLLIANQEGMFGGSDEETARQIADALAPHLELMRREAVAPPFIPGWKRAPKL